MLELLQVLTVLLVATAMGLSLAHALEMPGKFRLDRQAYVAIQQVYYPGFTIGGGIGEFGGIIATAALVLALPFGQPPFWLALGALLLLLAMHAVYWLFTHPTNRFWLQTVELGRAGREFFSADPLRQAQDLDEPRQWQAMRDQWEYSHVARAVLAGLSLTLLATAASL